MKQNKWIWALALACLVVAGCKRAPQQKHEEALEIAKEKEVELYADPSRFTPEELAAYAAGSTRITAEKIAEHGAEIRAKKKLICLDLDGTLTQHKTPMGDDVRAALDSLRQHYQLVMISGGGCDRIYKQMGEYPIDILGNYGMQESTVENGKFKLIAQHRTVPNTSFFLTKCQELREKYGYTHYYGNPVEFHQSGMVTFGLLGTDAPAEEKLNFDVDKKKRQAMYPEVCKVFSDYAVFIGGTTSFDIAAKRYNKYDAAMRYAEKRGIKKDEILYIGDDMGDGGNDSHIRLYGMDYIQSEDYRNFPQLVEFLYK